MSVPKPARTVTPATREQRHPFMQVVGYIIFGGVALLFLPVAPFILLYFGLTWLLSILGARDPDAENR